MQLDGETAQRAFRCRQNCPYLPILALQLGSDIFRAVDLTLACEAHCWDNWLLRDLSECHTAFGTLQGWHFGTQTSRRISVVPCVLSNGSTGSEWG